MSQVIKEKLQGELDELESELRIHLPKEIKRALEFGDLRENSEYRAALDRQNVVKARIVELRQRISEIASIDPTKVPRDKASYGSTLVPLTLSSVASGASQKPSRLWLSRQNGNCVVDGNLDRMANCSFRGRCRARHGVSGDCL